jgi:hypothetical protein
LTELRAGDGRAATHQLAIAAQFLRPQLVRNRSSHHAMIRVYDAAGDVHPAVQPRAAFEPDAIKID